MTDQVPIPAPLTAENLPPINIHTPITDIPPPSIPAPIPPPFPESKNSDLENLAKNISAEEEKIYAKRFKIIEELLATEWVYVNDLKTLVSVSTEQSNNNKSHTHTLFLSQEWFGSKHNSTYAV
jgi:hypothetical protein